MTGALQVMVLDPNLIPQFVDVIIGDYLYELQFRVEENMDANNLEPMEVDHGGDNGGNKEQEGDKGNDQMEMDNTAANRDMSGAKPVSGSSQQGDNTSAASQPRQVIHLTIPGVDIQCNPVPIVETMSTPVQNKVNIENEMLASPAVGTSTMTSEDGGLPAGLATPESLAQSPRCSRELRLLVAANVGR